MEIQTQQFGKLKFNMRMYRVELPDGSRVEMREVLCPGNDQEYVFEIGKTRLRLSRSNGHSWKLEQLGWIPVQ